jgi:hypothetical protein
LGGGEDYLSRKKADGTIDSSFGDNGTVQYFNNPIDEIRLFQSPPQMLILLPQAEL